MSCKSRFVESSISSAWQSLKSLVPPPLPKDLVKDALLTRNVQELKRLYRKEFFLAAKGGKGTCRHCGEKTKCVKKYKSRSVQQNWIFKISVNIRFLY